MTSVTAHQNRVNKTDSVFGCAGGKGKKVEVTCDPRVGDFSRVVVYTTARGKSFVRKRDVVFLTQAKGVLVAF
jgi:hypothetical protein